MAFEIEKLMTAASETIANTVEYTTYPTTARELMSLLSHLVKTVRILPDTPVKESFVFIDVREVDGYYYDRTEVDYDSTLTSAIGADYVRVAFIKGQSTDEPITDELIAASNLLMLFIEAISRYPEFNLEGAYRHLGAVYKRRKVRDLVTKLTNITIAYTAIGGRSTRTTAVVYHHPVVEINYPSEVTLQELQEATNLTANVVGYTDNTQILMLS